MGLCKVVLIDCKVHISIQYTVDIDYLNTATMPCHASVVVLVVSWGDLLKAKLHSIYLELQPEGSRRGSQNSAA